MHTPSTKPHHYHAQDGTANIERVLSFFRSGGGEDRANDAAGHNRSPGRGGGSPRRRRSYLSNDDDGDDEDDETLQGARDKLREGLLRLDGSGRPGGNLSPRRLFEYLDSDGVGEVHEL